MKWARAKTIFIIIFLFVNIFLYAIYRMNSDEGKAIDVDSVTAVLSNYGISANTGEFQSLPSQVAQFEAKQLQSAEDFAESFFNQAAKKESGKYVAGTETATFTEKGINYKNSSPDSRGFNGINKHNAPSRILGYLEKRGIQKNSLIAERVSASGSDSFTVTFNYSFNGKKILNHTLFATAGNKGITEIKGPLLTFNEIKKGIYHTVSWPSALLDFISFYGSTLFPEPSEIKSVNVGYYVSTDSESLSAYAIPAYNVTLADGRVFYLDGRTNIEPEFILLNK